MTYFSINDLLFWLPVSPWVSLSPCICASPQPPCSGRGTARSCSRRGTGAPRRPAASRPRSPGAGSPSGCPCQDRKLPNLEKRSLEVYTVEWLIFPWVLFSHFFPNAFQREWTTQEKIIRYMSRLNKHGEVLVLTHWYLIFGLLKLKISIKREN